MDDVRAVMDAVGSRRAAFYALSEGASMSILWAATYPDARSPPAMWRLETHGGPKAGGPQESCALGGVGGVPAGGRRGVAPPTRAPR